mmetsp:Transcript_29229/g.61169  ORF Transcript_29229/g.61169 Transcript_29229/m.61169 type:complete len:116 (+) Transcript_29229:1189-1536(+)
MALDPHAQSECDPRKSRRLVEGECEIGGVGGVTTSKKQRNLDPRRHFQNSSNCRICSNVHIIGSRISRRIYYGLNDLQQLQLITIESVMGMGMGIGTGKVLAIYIVICRRHLLSS